MSTRQLTTLSMMAAVAIMISFFSIPVMPPPATFLRYDPKDVIIVIGGFMFGPFAVVMLAAVTSLVEMVTISESGIWGFLMNFLSSSAFAVPAAYLYKKYRTLMGAVVGLLVGIACVIPVMLLWNFIMVPIYTGMPREVVATWLVPIFLPFNAIKYGLNAAIAMLVYKPVVTVLTSAGLYRDKRDTGARSARLYMGVVAAAVFIIVSLVLVILILQGVL